MPLTPYQQRVVDEKTELDSKLSKLKDFLELSPIFPTLCGEEQERLQRQAGIMELYSRVLGDRIESFDDA